MQSRVIWFYCCFNDVRNVNLELRVALNLLISSELGTCIFELQRT